MRSIKCLYRFAVAFWRFAANVPGTVAPEPIHAPVKVEVELDACVRTLASCVVFVSRTLISSELSERIKGV